MFFVAVEDRRVFLAPLLISSGWVVSSHMAIAVSSRSTALRCGDQRIRGFLFLRTETKGMHEFTDVTRVEVDTCHALADIRDALASPAIHGETPVQRPEFQTIEQLLLIFAGDAPAGPRVGFCVQGIRAALEPCRVPFADGSAADLEFTGDAGLVDFVGGEEFGCASAAFLELRFGESSGFPCHGVMILVNANLEMRGSVIKLIAACEALLRATQREKRFQTRKSYYIQLSEVAARSP